MSDTKEAKRRLTWTRRIAAATGHLVAVALMTLSTILWFLPPAAANRVVGWIRSDEALLEATMFDMAFHVVLCALMWAFLFLIFCHVKQRARSLKRVSLRPSRGSVITETLVVMPVFLLMTFGMSQLVVNSIAGVLMNVAAFQAGRAYWVWQPEEGGGRADGASAEAKARIAAAAVMTPVAPGGYGSNIFNEIINFGSFPDDAGKMRNGLAAANVPFGEVIPSGAQGFLADLGSISLENDRSFWRALDSQTFLQRSVTKFTFAYESTAVTPATNDGRLGVEVTYLHFQAMPVVDRLFGDPRGGLFGDDAPGDVKGYYTTYERTYTYNAQMALPNSNMPDPGGASAIPEDSTGAGDIEGTAGDNCTGEDCG